MIILGEILVLEAVGPVNVPRPKPSDTKSPDGTRLDDVTGESVGMDTCRGVGLNF
jgi:hypothetical protein